MTHQALISALPRKGKQRWQVTMRMMVCLGMITSLGKAFQIMSHTWGLELSKQWRQHRIVQFLKSLCYQKHSASNTPISNRYKFMLIQLYPNICIGQLYEFAASGICGHHRREQCCSSNKQSNGPTKTKGEVAVNTSILSLVWKMYLALGAAGSVYSSRVLAILNE
mmetsp:Transcript_30002/g.69976  ORF Transcript_30002/g.69976 Transcript_30002/m.69976 type:complete len:166 (+) Transcript_30002:467-964(+)